MAQLVARMHGVHEAVGSSPTTPTKSLLKNMQQFIEQNLLWVLPILLVLVIWSTVWKGLALWRAAKLNQPVWFVVLLVVNMVGILEILYLYIFSKKSARK